MKPQITFLPVKDANAKLKQICAHAHQHFIQKQRLLFITPDIQGAEFLDKLLWRLPADSFIPHALIENSSTEQIAITTSIANLNSASYIFNLTPSPLLLDLDCKGIYELEDLSSPDRQQLSAKRFSAYRDAGYAISSLNL